MTEEGLIEAITGCMFSGKTEELLRRLKQVKIAKQKFQLFKPRTDTEYGGLNRVISHSGNETEAISIDFEQPEKIIAKVEKGTEVVAIDEAQFFPPQITNVVSLLADQGKRVIIAGLDLDFRGEPFGSMPFILAIAEEIDKLTAICEICGKEATRTLRLIKRDDARIVVIPGAGRYKAVCRKHHIF